MKKIKRRKNLAPVLIIIVISLFCLFLIIDLISLYKHILMDNVEFTCSDGTGFKISGKIPLNYELTINNTGVGRSDRDYIMMPWNNYSQCKIRRYLDNGK